MNRKLSKILTSAVSAALVLSCGTVYAQDNVHTGKTPDDGYIIVTDGCEYDGDILFVSDNAYVSLREFSCMADNSVVSWDDASETAFVETDTLTLSAAEGNRYIEANGRVLWCPLGVFTQDGKMYVPLRQIAEAFGFSSEYSAEDNATYLERRTAAIESADSFYDEDELYWLSKLIHAEACGEPFEGKLAVGTVVLNRVDSDEFPSTIYDVIFDTEHGVQFTPTANGAIDNEAHDDSIIAAKICLEDVRLDDDILYFLNEELSTSLWIVENCEYVMTIGSHDFYTE